MLKIEKSVEKNIHQLIPFSGFLSSRMLKNILKIPISGEIIKKYYLDEKAHLKIKADETLADAKKLITFYKDKNETLIKLIARRGRSRAEYELLREVVFLHEIFKSRAVLESLIIARVSEIISSKILDISPSGIDESLAQKKLTDYFDIKFMLSKKNLDLIKTKNIAQVKLLDSGSEKNFLKIKSFDKKISVELASDDIEKILSRALISGFSKAKNFI